MHSINKTAAVIIGCFVLALVFLAPPLIQADEWNRATKFTVNKPFEVPNLVLQPNTPYVIRLLDSPSERHVVQILNEDQTKLLTMFIAISDERTQATDKTVFTFIEMAPGYPLPMKEWFYPGRLIGLEFVYPKAQAMEIARHAPTTTTQTASITKTDETPVFEEKPEPVVDNEQAAEQPVEQEPEQIAQNDNDSSLKGEPEVQREKPAETAVTEESNNNEELPRTAGELPLVALIGALCLGAGLGLKVLSAKS